MFQEIIEQLKVNKDEIIKVLTEIETENVALEEYRLSMLALHNNSKYTNKKVDSISSYLPMNLPLYSLVLYTIIPRLCNYD